MPLRLIPAVMDLYLKKKALTSNLIRSSEDLFSYLYVTLRGKPQEMFYGGVFKRAKPSAGDGTAFDRHVDACEYVPERNCSDGVKTSCGFGGVGA